MTRWMGWLTVAGVGALAPCVGGGLRDYAGTNMLIGSQVTAAVLGDVFPYYDVVRREFSIITDDGFRMKNIQPAEGVFDFAERDALIDWARSNGLAVRAHALLYDHPSCTPDWVLAKTATWTRADAITILSNHISTVVDHFRGRVAYYDVVNEVIQDDGTWKPSLWVDAIGRDVVALAFGWAHAADPGAVLYWNEQRCERLNLKAYAVWTNMQALVTNGAPVHGFGTQGHVALGWYTTNATEITSNLNMFAELGLETQMTECDVRIYAADGVSRAELMQQQRDYENIVRACRSASKCTAFVMWGFSDAYSWIPGGHPGYDAACMYDKVVRRKPAYYGVRNALVPLMYEYRCDEVGVQCTNTGSETAVVRLVATNGAAADAHTAERGGVTGRPYDRALDTRGGSCVGISTGVWVDAAALTLMAWVKAAEAPGSGMCVLALGGASNGFRLGEAAGGAVRLEVNGRSVESAAGVWGASGVWQCVAVTYDSQRETSNVVMYAGTRTDELAVAGVETLNAGPVVVADGSMVTGAAGGDGAQAVRGVLDCVRVSTAVVCAAQLEALRNDDASEALPLLVEYRFDETAAVARSTGFLAEELGMKNSAGVATNLHSADGEGCTGLPGDRAFDNRGSTGMGDGFSGGRCEHTGDVEALDRVWSFTISGWIKPHVALGGGAGMVHNQTSSGFGYALTAARGANVNDLALNVDNLELETAGENFAGSGEWVFVAAAYDGTRTVSNAVMYRGTHFTPVELVAVGTVNRGRTEPEGERLVLGNVSFAQRPLDGLMDNVAVYASKFDHTGVLSAEELEQVRLRDALPEPGGMGIGLIGPIGLITWRLRGRG